MNVVFIENPLVHKVTILSVAVMVRCMDAEAMEEHFDKFM
jgi:hypothetical protein